MSVAVNLTYPDLRRRLSKLVLERDAEWCGCPVPIEGLQLSIEDRSPYKKLESLFADDAASMEPGLEIVNHWRSRRRECKVWIYREQGKLAHATLPSRPSTRKFHLLLKTFEATWAHDAVAEYTAMAKLEELIGEQKMRYYLLVGAFVETSKRSGVSYVFRRARPTIAFRADADGARMLAALCLHPIGYYHETHVGAMTPTDDVIAHLMLMRGDEPMFWRRANQHAPESPEAGL